MTAELAAAKAREAELSGLLLECAERLEHLERRFREQVSNVDIGKEYCRIHRRWIAEKAEENADLAAKARKLLEPRP